MSRTWNDLIPRLLSGVVMLGLGTLAIWAGGLGFRALVILVTALMIWELARMTARPASAPAEALAAVAAAVLVMILLLPGALPTLLLLVPSILGQLRPRADRVVFAAYAVVVMVTGFGLILLREMGGATTILWIVALVVASDVMGYFAGRLLGGPKFWPRVSPKKTWSGTVAGWIGAACVGWAFHAAGLGGAALIWISPLIAFAGQLGDIAESAIKRRAGVKDSSSLIPGHGGVLDRFDALAFAVVLVSILAHVVDLPVSGG